MDLNKVPEDVEKIIIKYCIEIERFERNKKIKEGLKLKYFYVYEETYYSQKTRIYNKINNTYVLYEYIYPSERGLYGFRSGLYIQKFNNVRLLNVKCIYKEGNKEKINLNVLKEPKNTF